MIKIVKQNVTIKILSLGGNTHVWNCRIFKHFLWTAQHITTRYHIWSSVRGVLIVYSNGSAQLNKMAAMSIYGKNTLKSSLPDLRKLWSWILVCSTGVWLSTKFVQIMTVCWPLTFLQQSQICITSDWWSGGPEFDPRWFWQHSFMEIKHEIFFTVIFFFFCWFIKDSCQFLVKECAWVLVNWLKDYACPGKVWLGKLTS